MAPSASATIMTSVNAALRSSLTGPALRRLTRGDGAAGASGSTSGKLLAGALVCELASTSGSGSAIGSEAAPGTDSASALCTVDAISSGMRGCRPIGPE